MTYLLIIDQYSCCSVTCNVVFSLSLSLSLSHTHTHTHTHAHAHTHTHTHTHMHTHTHTHTHTRTHSLNNPILEGGFEIICSPSTPQGTVDGVRKALQVCQVELHPFFIFGHDGKSPLNSQVCVCVCEREREIVYVMKENM